MQKFFNISILILCVLAFSRFIPHPPNFTSLLALSFYVPVIFGLRYLPILLISFAITDFIIGYHTLTFFTWGSIFVIGLMAQLFNKTLLWRISGSLTGALIFFVFTNFGVWTTGMYGLDLAGIKTTYLLAIPFFAYSILSTLIFSLIIELIYKLYISYKIKINSQS